MLTVLQAAEIVLQHALPPESETVSLDKALHRVLREPLIADRDFPPFDRVSMDGIAIAYQVFARGQRTFAIEGIQAAGTPPQTLTNPNTAVEVMTGATLPIGTDTVIRYEDLKIAQGTAMIQTEDVRPGQNVHPRAHDRRAGDIIVPAGKQIGAAEIGVAATIGKHMLEVARLPRVAIVTTGDELVRIQDTPLPHQIRMSNAHALQALLAPWGIHAAHLHLPDDLKATQQALEATLPHTDVFLLSGGVSAGKYDYVPQALENMGFKQLFYKVLQRPGKPFWFGERHRRQVVFALPGNPVSAFLNTLRYVIPWLRRSLGMPDAPTPKASLATPFVFKPSLTYFLQVRLQINEQGQLLAWPVAGKGSGDLANLADADAFLELPLERSQFEVGEVFPLWLYRYGI